MVAIRTVIGGSLYVLIATPSLAQQSWLNLGLWTWIAILAGGAIGVGVGQWVKVRALRSLGPTQVVIYGNLVPIAAIVIAWFAIGNHPSVYELLAGALIIIGAIFIQVIDGGKRKLSSDSLAQRDDEMSIMSSAKQE
jgi:drug/metabolite transporter (DMT)-like permease